MTERYRLGDDNKIVMETASGKAVRVIKCILCASLSDNNNHERFIGVILASGKALLESNAEAIQQVIQQYSRFLVRCVASCSGL